MIHLLLAGLLVMAMPAMAQQAAGEGITHIFFSAGCADCCPYTQEQLIPALQSQGITGPAEIHDYTSPDGRAVLGDMNEALVVRRFQELQSYVRRMLRLLIAFGCPLQINKSGLRRIESGIIEALRRDPIAEAFLVNHRCRCDVPPPSVAV